MLRAKKLTGGTNKEVRENSAYRAILAEGTRHLLEPAQFLILGCGELGEQNTPLSADRGRSRDNGFCWHLVGRERAGGLGSRTPLLCRLNGGIIWPNSGKLRTPARKGLASFFRAFLIFVV
jgi:hypothetical protein